MIVSESTRRSPSPYRTPIHPRPPLQPGLDVSARHEELFAALLLVVPPLLDIPSGRLGGVESLALFASCAILWATLLRRKLNRAVARERAVVARPHSA